MLVFRLGPYFFSVPLLEVVGLFEFSRENLELAAEQTGHLLGTLEHERRVEVYDLAAALQIDVVTPDNGTLLVFDEEPAWGILASGGEFFCPQEDLEPLPLPLPWQMGGPLRGVGLASQGGKPVLCCAKTDLSRWLGREK